MTQQGSFSAALVLIEESVDLLRDMPPFAWLLYLMGVVPFFAAFLFETTDIYESPFAADRLPWAALLLAFAYIWMHICQATFTSRLDASVRGIAAQSIPNLRGLSVLTMVQATKLVVWPVAAFLVIPHSFVTMFYQHALCRSNGELVDLSIVVSEAKRDAAYKHSLAVWFLVLILLLRVAVWINCLALLLGALLLFHSFTGIENTLTRQPAVLFNPTFMTALCVLAYLALDPIVKAACVMRAFERASVTSGLDLRLRLAKIKEAASAVSVFVVLLMTLPAIALCHRDSTRPDSISRESIDPKRIEHAITEVFKDSNLSWTLPVVVKRKPPSNVFFQFTESVGNKIGELWDGTVKGWQDFVARIRKLLSPSEPDAAGDRGTVARSQEIWLLVVVFAALLAAAVLFALLRSRNFKPSVIVEPRQAEMPAQDLNREDIQPDEQPEDEWLRLASEYRKNGEYRLAMRALYLSCLSSLAAAKLISIARGKSNLDYSREFRRRTRRFSAQLSDCLEANVLLFERGWYGAHDVTEDVLDLIDRNREFLKVQTTRAAL